MIIYMEVFLIQKIVQLQQQITSRKETAKDDTINSIIQAAISHRK